MKSYFQLPTYADRIKTPMLFSNIYFNVGLKEKVQIYECSQFHRNVIRNLFRQQQWQKQQLKTRHSLTEVSFIRQLAKRDHHKEHDMQPSCTRCSTSRPKNDENHIQEADSNHLNYYVLVDWLLIL